MPEMQLSPSESSEAVGEAPVKNTASFDDLAAFISRVLGTTLSPYQIEFLKYGQQNDILRVEWGSRNARGLPLLSSLSLEEKDSLLKSGMFWEFYPEG